MNPLQLIDTVFSAVREESLTAELEDRNAVRMDKLLELATLEFLAEEDVAANPSKETTIVRDLSSLEEELGVGSRDLKRKPGVRWAEHAVQRSVQGALRDTSPTAFVVVGALGSALEWVVEAIRQALADRPKPVFISLREFLLLHPDCPHAMRTAFDQRRLEEDILKDVRAAGRQLLEVCILHRYSLILECTGMEALALGRNLGLLSSASYQTHLILCPSGEEAIHRRMSALSDRFSFSSEAQQWWKEFCRKQLQEACRSLMETRTVERCASLTIVEAAGGRETTWELDSPKDVTRLLGRMTHFVPGTPEPKVPMPPAPEPLGSGVKSEPQEQRSEKKLISSGKGFKLVETKGRAKQEQIPEVGKPPPDSNTSQNASHPEKSKLPGSKSSGAPSNEGGQHPSGRKARGVQRHRDDESEDTDAVPSRTKKMSEPETLSGEELRAKAPIPDLESLPPLRRKTIEKRLELVRKVQSRADPAR